MRYTTTCKEKYFTGGVFMKNIENNHEMDNKIKSDSSDLQRIEEVDKIVELSLLYDFYGELLKEHQKHIFEDYILNDLSLAEIADEEGISRQGVHDIVKRCTKLLMSYEEKLKLIKKFVETKNRVNQIQQIANDIEVSGDYKQVDEIVRLTNTILEDL